MTTPAEHAKRILSDATDADRGVVLHWLRERTPIHPLETEWGASAEMILEAISRASDISRRGVLGLLAEAACARVLSRVKGWLVTDGAAADPFDFTLTRGEEVIRVQAKRQRIERGAPRPYRVGSSLMAVETQRTRGGRDRTTGEATRPYRFGDFDILAVCVQPSTGKWEQFRYVPARWLLPRSGDSTRIATMQPVSLHVNDDWTDDPVESIARFRLGEARRISQE